MVNDKPIGTHVDKAKNILRNADAVMLDVDGTLIQELPLHELAKFCKNEEPVITLAAKAITDDRPFKEALSECMDVLKPSRNVITGFIKSKALNFSSKGKDLVRALQEKKIPIYLVAGSFDTFIKPIARDVNIDPQYIYANKLEFFFDGGYAGLKQDSVMMRNFGKTVLASQLKKQYKYKNLVNIGDGLTDLNAQEVTDAFIGYGGNIERCEVKSGAMWYTKDFTDLIEVIKGKN